MAQHVNHQIVRSIYSIVNQYSNRSPIDVVLDFLQNPESDQEVAALGLSPNQVEQEPTEDAILALKKCLEFISTSKRSKSLFKHFQEQYPSITQRLLDELAQQQIQQEIQERGPPKSELIKERIRTRMIGQNEAVNLLAHKLAEHEETKESKQSPVFLFVGPSGVGKTELAKAVSGIKNGRFVRFDMANFSDEFSITTLFGSAAGLEGSTSPPTFLTNIKELKPVYIKTANTTEFYKVVNAVILLDEFENAHEKIKQRFLALFDEGYCDCFYTKKPEAPNLFEGKNSKNITLKYTFEKCIFIGTSNLFQGEIVEGFKRKIPIKKITEIFKAANQYSPSLKNYTPQLLGRMVPILFGPLPRGEYKKILKMKLLFFFETLKKRGFKEVSLENEDLTLKALQRGLYGDGTDIRKIGKYLDNTVDVTLSEQLIQLGKLETKKLVFTTQENKFAIEIWTFVDFYGMPKYTLTKTLICEEFPEKPLPIPYISELFDRFQ